MRTALCPAAVGNAGGGGAGSALESLFKVGLTCMAYHILGLTDDIRVTAPNMDWGFPSRHPHRSTWKWKEGNSAASPEHIQGLTGDAEAGPAHPQPPARLSVRGNVEV